MVHNYFLNPNIRSRRRSHLSSCMFFQNTRGSTDHAWCHHDMLIDIELIRFRLLQHQDRVSTKQTHQSDTFMLMRTIAPTVTGCVIEANNAVVKSLHLAGWPCMRLDSIVCRMHVVVSQHIYNALRRRVCPHVFSNRIPVQQWMNTTFKYCFL